jgi:tetratricopeptide (TPR) repeat protein
MLVEMGDLEAAGRHLRTLEMDGLAEAERKRMLIMQVMVWLQIGDLRAAKRCLANIYDSSTDTNMSPTLEAMDPSSSDDYAARVLHALAQMAEGNFATAADEWEALEEDHENDDMVIQNRAICLLYTGRMLEGHQCLEQAVEQSESAPFHALLFNLCTFYELSSDRAREMKTSLMERVAQVPPGPSGWQRSTADFKMEALRA